MSENVLTMYTIYDHPDDYPKHFVVRALHIVRGQEEPVPGYVTALCDTIEEARANIPPGLFVIPRSPADEPQIVETWT